MAPVELVGLAHVIVLVLGVHPGRLHVLALMLVGFHRLGGLRPPGQVLLPVVGREGNVEAGDRGPVNLFPENIRLDSLFVEFLFVDCILRQRNPRYYSSRVCGLEVFVRLVPPFRIIVLVVRHPEHRLLLKSLGRVLYLFLGEGLLRKLRNILGVLLEGEVAFVVWPTVDDQPVRGTFVREVSLVNSFIGDGRKQVKFLLARLLLTAYLAYLLEVVAVVVD
jgi:hypothetical protein